MNCGLCGPNERAPLRQGGTWEDNKSSRNVSAFHSLGSVLTKEKKKRSTRRTEKEWESGSC